MYVETKTTGFWKFNLFIKWIVRKHIGWYKFGRFLFILWLFRNFINYLWQLLSYYKFSKQDHFPGHLEQCKDAIKSQRHIFYFEEAGRGCPAVLPSQRLMFQALEGAHFTPSLCQCSFLRVFKATAIYTEQKEVRTRMWSHQDSNSEPLSQKAVH